MRAWAAKVAGRGRESFCEQCGAAGTIRAERQVADRPRAGELLACRGCSLLTCPACWPGPFLACRACCVRQDPVLVALVGEAPLRDVSAVPGAMPTAAIARARPPRSAVLAAAAVLVIAIVGGAMTLTSPRSGAGGVAGLTARSTPSASTPARPESPSAAPSGTPTATTSPAPEPTRPAAPTARPGTPADLRVTSSAVLPWSDPLGELRAQVLVGVTNRGGSAGYLPASGTAWEVLSPDGFAVAQGRFAHVFPPLIEPGATAWLVDAVSATFTEPGDLDDLRVTLDERAATPAEMEEAVPLAVTDVDWQLDEAGHLSVSGVVRNDSKGPVGRWSAAVVLVAADGAPLAAAYEIADVDEVEPGETARFSTSYPGSAPVDRAQVATVVAVAVPLE